MEKTTFVTQWGTFYYKVMPFGLKNAGVTYQRAMVALFHDIIHHEIEVYVDDMIARSQTEEERVWVDYAARILLSPAVKDLFSSAIQRIRLHAHMLHPYIININKTHILHNTFHAT